jgi:hypothetical protein
MAIVINGSGTITGISAGGLPDGSVTAADIAAGTITNDKLANSSVTVNGTAISLGGSESITAGKVLQVVQVTKTNVSSYSTNINVGSSSYPTVLSASITPSSTSSKIMCIYHLSGSSGNGIHIASVLRRNGSPIFIGDAQGSSARATTGIRGIGGNAYTIATQSANYIDSPSSTSALTYTVGVATENGNTFYANFNGMNSSGTSWHASYTSNIILMEIAG